jgi:16S rRNA (adenine1518-N6/adenine1519-N6)-dimethyltransferase
MHSDASPQPRPRQTQSFLRDLFHERGLKPKNKLGQNFLIDLNLLDFAVREAELSRGDMVLEVGTGTAGLTALLAERAGAVLSVELDPAFHALAKETLGDRGHVQLIHSDILKNKNLLHPTVIERLRDGWRRFQELQADDVPAERRMKLVANLPYAVAVPVISNLLLTDLPFERMVVTVQWEIAERLIARPGTKDYGALAVLIQSIADVEVLRRLPSAVFWPRPQVASAIIRIRPNAGKRSMIGDVSGFRNFLRDLYAHRRKNLRGGLLNLGKREWTKEQVDAKLAELHIDAAARAETLGLEEHRRLFEAFG